jgi:hypothetical protein
MIYIATGNNYAEPSQKTTDAVIALDMGSGAIQVGEPGHRRRQLDARLSGQEPRQPELPEHARGRS